jgi:Predicted nucleic-acid-binding protein, contains PIN domain
MKYFFDSNILVYSRDPRDPRKMEIARSLVTEAMDADAFVVSTQVLVEFYVACARERLLGAAEALTLVRLWNEHDTVSHTPDLVLRALQLHQAHSLSVWDSLIVQAAADSGCDVLLTEDLQHGRRFGDLEISNPFLSGAHEPARAKYQPRTKRKTRV